MAKHLRQWHAWVPCRIAAGVWLGLLAPPREEAHAVPFAYVQFLERQAGMARGALQVIDADAGRVRKLISPQETISPLPGFGPPHPSELSALSLPILDPRSNRFVDTVEVPNRVGGRRVVYDSGILRAGPSGAQQACRRRCKEETLRCKTTRCAGLRGRASKECREECKERCRGLGGCTTIRTLAYVVTECHEVGQDPQGTAEVLGRQVLQIRRENRDPTTVLEFATAEPLSDPFCLCRRFGVDRVGYGSVIGGVFQRLAVSPDGSAVVFEVTNQFQLLPHRFPLSPEQEGIFLVRSDGSGLRRLGPASRNPSYRIVPTPIGPGASFANDISFSPDGRRIAYTDMGPSLTGDETVQVVILDLLTGRSFQVTHLPSPSSVNPSYPFVTLSPSFLDNETIVFETYTNPDSSNPKGDLRVFKVKSDGTGLRSVPPPVTLPGSRVVPIFQITSSRPDVLILALPGTAVNKVPGFSTITEVFRLDGRNLLQLTNFGRIDTTYAFPSADGQRVFLAASANPLGKNPSENCQFFSIDTLGGHLRQLRRFREGDARSVNGCSLGPPPGCGLGPAVQDPVTSTIVFYSSCDPFGTNPYGSQIFTMRPDGSKLRQLTDTRGCRSAPTPAPRCLIPTSPTACLSVGADPFTVELPGPFAYSAR